MEELRHRFLPRFLRAGQERVRRALDACIGDSRLDVVATEVHALAGEAALLELREIVSLARAAEVVARAPSGGAADACRSALRDILAALEALGVPEPPSAALEQPTFVTVAIACRDDEAHIEACVRAAQAQDWPRDKIEILVADGMSLDATREILGRLASADPRISLVDNPARSRASGLNECIRRARGDVVARIDVRGDCSPDFVRRCVEALERTGADHVGGVPRPQARTFFQRCVAAALASPLVTARARRRQPDESGFVESVCPGAFRRAVFERVGLFDPNALATTEDAELDHRILDAGGRVYESGDIAPGYAPPESMGQLARQYYRFGKGRARTFVKHRKLRSLRPVLPLLGLAGQAILLFTAPWHVGGLSIAAYALATGAEAIRVARPAGIAAIPVVWAIFPVLHASHGVGFASGLVTYVLRPDWDEPERLTGAPHAALAHT
jgi:succinoglycan biosynthesis protein ExoA